MSEQSWPCCAPLRRASSWRLPLLGVHFSFEGGAVALIAEQQRSHVWKRDKQQQEALKEALASIRRHVVLSQPFRLSAAQHVSLYCRNTTTCRILLKLRCVRLVKSTGGTVELKETAELISIAMAEESALDRVARAKQMLDSQMLSETDLAELLTQDARRKQRAAEGLL